MYEKLQSNKTYSRSDCLLLKTTLPQFRHKILHTDESNGIKNLHLTLHSAGSGQVNCLRGPGNGKVCEDEMGMLPIPMMAITVYL